MEDVLKMFWGAIERFKQTGEPIYTDDKREATIITNELRRYKMSVIIEKTENGFFIIKKIAP